jgi:hypothetical protein
MVRVLFQQKNLHQYVDEQIDLTQADIQQPSTRWLPAM